MPALAPSVAMRSLGSQAIPVMPRPSPPLQTIPTIPVGFFRRLSLVLRRRPGRPLVAVLGENRRALQDGP